MQYWLSIYEDTSKKILNPMYIGTSFFIITKIPVEVNRRARVIFEEFLLETIGSKVYWVRGWAKLHPFFNVFCSYKDISWLVLLNVLHTFWISR